MKVSLIALVLALCCSEPSFAQLWTGSLGPPIINITFGSADSGNYQLPGHFTTYQPGDMCPVIGDYGIGSKSFGCNTQGKWLQLVGDHYFPGDIGGNYMIVNAEGTPGTVFSDTAKALCGNTTYQFAAWITNAMQPTDCNGSPELADLSFNVQTLAGTPIASYQTGGIPTSFSKQWIQYGFSFKTPPNSDGVILTITTNPHNRCGSVFGIDDITLNECGPKVTATIDGSTAAADVCADYTNPFLMQVNIGPGYTDPVQQWQESLDSGKTWQNIPGAVTSTYQVPHRLSGEILYRSVVAERANINSPNCQTASNIIHTDIHPLAAHTPPQNFLGCLSKDLFMPRTDPAALKILWTGPNAYQSDKAAAVLPDVQYKDTGLYTLKETFYFGCVTLDTFFLKVFPGTTLSLQPPTALCEGGHETLMATGTGGGTFQWVPATGLSSDKIGNPVAKPSISTEYEVYYTNTYGCKDSAYAYIKVYKNPIAYAGTGKVILLGDTLTLNGIVQGTSINYYWTPPQYMDDPQSLSPKVSPVHDMQYTLHTISNVGCGEVASSVLVKVYDDIFIPNAFTPNGDGKNDVFHILALDSYRIVSFLIYDREGKAVYRGTNTSAGWDGTYRGMPQPVGTYIYYLELQNQQSGKKVMKKGTILLLR